MGPNVRSPWGWWQHRRQIRALSVQMVDLSTALAEFTEVDPLLVDELLIDMLTGDLKPWVHYSDDLPPELERFYNLFSNLKALPEEFRDAL